tara:strand:+ start:1037 stop:1669 length:633 start_codon:yes stop_codon:yes gene_type:complete
MNDFKNILVIAPHTDDGEFGCGGSISKFIEKGYNVYYLAFSTAEESVPQGYPKNILETEVKEANEILGIPIENLILYKYRVRHLAEHRQEILQILVDLNKNLNPDLVFIPSLNDIHQDHSTVAMEGLRAYKNTSILCYEVPWNNLNFNTQCFISLEKRHIEKKIDALSCYKSQMQKPYASSDFIYSLAKTRGTQINEKYSEVFEVLRWKI